MSELKLKDILPHIHSRQSIFIFKDNRPIAFTQAEKCDEKLQNMIVRGIWVESMNHLGIEVEE